MAEVADVLKPVLEKIAEDKKYYDYSTKVSSINSGGANYSSQLYNVTLSAAGRDDIKLFAKVAALGQNLRSMTNVPLFEAEYIFYSKILSEYREYEEKYKFSTEDRLVLPKFYGASIEYMKEVIVLEELTCRGYEPFDRFKCYDWEYAATCLSYLAKLHALSVRYRTDNSDEFADITQRQAFEFPINEITEFIKKGIPTTVGVVADEYKERFTKFVTENVTKEKLNVYYNSPRKVVLTHGDFRPSNILHKTNNDGKLEVVAVDYQVLLKGNPVTDLIYFLISGSDEEFREKYFNEFFEHYYEEFSKTLWKLEINPKQVYTKEEFDEDVKEMLPFGMVMGMMVLPIITVEERHAPKLDDGIELDDLTVKPSDLLKKRLNGLVKDYVKMNIL